MREKIENIIKENLKAKYYLAFVDRNDDLSSQLETINNIISGDNEYFELEDAVFTAYEEQIDNSLSEERKALLNLLIEKHPSRKEELEIYFEENMIEIEDLFKDRDESSVMDDLIRNTVTIPVVIKLMSNYDCIGSAYGEGYQYATEGEYFADAITALGLNPRNLKKVMKDNELTLKGSCNERKNKGYITEEDFVSELQNISCGACLLTFTARLNLKDLVKFNNREEIKSIIIPKGNFIGFYSSFQGGGSTFDANLLKDIELIKKDKEATKFMLKGAHSTSDQDEKYFYFSIEVDTSRKYNIKDTYGVTDEFFGKELKINIQGDKE